MLVRNILSIALFIGMTLSVPINKKREDTSVPLVPLKNPYEEKTEDTGGNINSPNTTDASGKEVKDVNSTPEAAFIPENNEILPEYKDTCTKDHVILGNHVTTEVCNDIYTACTTKELLSIIVYYYSKEIPVTIEYTINEGVNKENISEKCGAALINSKIFEKETTIISNFKKMPRIEKIPFKFLDQVLEFEDPNYHNKGFFGSKNSFARMGEEEIE